MTSAELGKLGALVMNWRNHAAEVKDESDRVAATGIGDDEEESHVAYNNGYGDALESAAADLAKLLES